MSAPADLICDVVVLGLGPGGEYAANKLARAGLDVVAVDELLVGGECPFFGCTPSKLMIRGGNVLAEARRVDGLGGTVEVHPDWTVAADRVRKATNDWHDHPHADRLEESGARIVRGHGRLDGPGRVAVDTPDGRVVLEGRRGVVLNSGTRPSVPPVDGLAGTPYWTNREVVRVDALPASLAVVGGGAIGCELAQVFARFGSQVTLLQSSDRLMTREEPEVSEVVVRALRREGIDVRLGASLDGVSYDGDAFTLTVDGERLEAERLLVATGRTPNLDDVGLDTVGLDPAAASVPVDERMRAGDGSQRLWVVGDVTGLGPYTHVARYQGAVAVRDLLGEDGPWAEYHGVTHVTFTDPEVGGVGLTEATAREHGIDVRVGTAQVERSARGWIEGDDVEGVVKVVADAATGVLVGASVAAPSGGEVLGLLSAAVHARTPVATLRGMHFAYLTFHRVVEAALADLDL